MGSRSFPDFIQLSQEITLCKVCNTHLPNGPRPVFQAHPPAQILIVGQVPGNAVDPSGIPFNDPSGDLAPRAQCADLWRERLLAELRNIELTIVIGRFALDWHLVPDKKSTRN